jgi:DNA polymerase-3 subunit delta'
MSGGAGVLDGAIAPEENTALFGHEEAAAFLARAYRSGKIHHAVLIEGPEGIGKATLAFRFANHVLHFPDFMEAPETLTTPDPASPIHRQIVSGASHHLLHLTRPTDEKTGRVKTAITVDEVRRAGRFLSQTSGTGNWRIVIVDPADDLNRAAANAILKILEEPPRNALFLVLSHAPGKLLPTIRSRCLPLRLQPLPDEAVRQALAHLGFRQSGPEGDLDAVVARAGGSVAKALMMLRYGGLEIAAALEAIMAGDPAKMRKDIHRLADTLTAKDREETFAFFQAELADWLTTRARTRAEAGDLAAAARMADLAGRIEADWAEAAAYNLDRKQAILSVFSTLSAEAA